MITLNVSIEFLTPKVGVGGWQFCKPTSYMAMPEAAVHEDCHLSAR
jgi:hypothetical protein